MTNKFMHAWLACLFSVPALFLPMLPAQSPPSFTASNATALLEKSLAATNLNSTGKDPYHLILTVKYKADGLPLTGRFEILFDPPDRYRMTVALGKASETQVLVGNKLYISRSPQKFSPESWRVTEFLWFPAAGLQTPSSINVGRQTTYPTVKVNGNCEEESDVQRVRNACFDSSQKIVSFSIHDQTGSNLGRDTVSLTDFHSAGERLYPAHLSKKSVWDTIEAILDTFAVERSTDAKAFMPPANSIERDWCISPQAITSTLPPRVVVTYALYVYYVLVGADGRAKKFSFVNDPPQFALSQAHQIFESKRYPIFACSGKPVEYDMVVVTNSY